MVIHFILFILLQYYGNYQSFCSLVKILKIISWKYTGIITNRLFKRYTSIRVKIGKDGILVYLVKIFLEGEGIEDHRFTL